VPKHELDPATPPPMKRSQTQTTKSITEDLTDKKSRAPLAIGAAVVLAAGGFGVYKLTRSSSTNVVTPPPGDARVDEAMGYLEIDPDPEGVTGTVTGDDGAAHPFGPTSHAKDKKVKLRVTPNTDLKVHLEAPGYQPFERVVRVEPNVTFSIAPALSKARSTLHVVTNPPGAQVALAGRFVGETPLTVADLDASPHAQLTLAHAGYETMKLEVALETGKTAEVSRDLKELPKLGEVKISVKGAWAEVYFKGKDLGRNKTLTSFTTFRLPVGKQTLELKNPSSGKHKTVTIDVTGKPQTVEFSLD
jgi:hypothetical protein